MLVVQEGAEENPVPVKEPQAILHQQVHHKEMQVAMDLLELAAEAAAVQLKLDKTVLLVAMVVKEQQIQ